MTEQEQDFQKCVAFCTGLTQEQRDELIDIAAMCQMAGADVEHLGPLYAACLLTDEQPSDKSLDLAAEVVTDAYLHPEKYDE